MSTPTRGWSTRRKLLSAVVAAVAVGLYAALAIFGAIDDRNQQEQPPSPGTDAQTVVWISVISVQPATETLTANVTVVPATGLVDQAGRLLDDLTLTLHPAVQQNPLSFARGTEIGTAPLQLVANGTFQRWPFDVYRTTNLIADVVAGKPPAERFLPSRVVVTGSIPEWKLTSTTSSRPDGQSTRSDVTVDRDDSTFIFGLLLCAILVALPVGALFVAILTVTGKRPFYATTLGWFAALLFAVVPLRTLFPGSPPLGGWIDRMVVIWVLAALVVAQGLYLRAWWKER